MNWEEWKAIAQDERHWQGHQEKGLLKVEYLHDYVLRLWFEEYLDVSIYEFDFYPLLLDEDPGEAFRPLRNKERFSMVKGDYALMWPDPATGEYDGQTLDLAPECVRFFCERYGNVVKSAHKKAA